MSHNWKWTKSQGLTVAECEDCGIQSDKPVHGKCPGPRLAIDYEQIGSVRINVPVATTGTTGGNMAIRVAHDRSIIDVELWSCPMTLRGTASIPDSLLVEILEANGYRVTKP